MRLHDVISELQHLNAAPAVEDGSVQALTIEDSVSRGYIWPNLQSWVKVEGARVALIEAPGAVGKTAAAQAIAAELKWPKVDASLAQVGSYSLSGLFLDALGFSSSYIGDVGAGRTGVVIDALDEARLKAGAANFHAFLDNVRKLSGKPGGAGITILLMSRPDTALIVKDLFQEWECPLAEGVLDFFSRNQAKDYVDSYMEKMNLERPDRNYDIGVRYRSAFEALRDKKMTEICRALLSAPDATLNGDWDKVASFLGYAPVLAVLAEYLAVPNPYAEVKSPDLGNNPKTVLLSVIDDILQRETVEKFQKSVTGRLKAEMPAEISWDGFDTLYSADEQCVRLAEKLLGVSITVDLPANLPDALRVPYEEKASQFFADHPFMAGGKAVNVVFGDYVKAKASVDPMCLASLEPDPRRYITSPGPFYYQFLSEFSTGHPESGEPNLPEVLVPMVMESQSQTARKGDVLLATYYQSDGEAYLSIKDTFGGPDEYIVFAISEPSGALHLPKQASRCLIHTDEGIIIGIQRTGFTLGPYAIISAQEIVIDAGVLSIEAGRTFGGVSVLISDNFAVNGPLTIDATVPESFAVDSSNPWPVLRPYVRSAPTPPDLANLNEYADLRAIIRAFRQRAGSDPSVFDDLLEKRIIKANSRRMMYLKALQKLGIVVHRSNRHYYLITDRLSKYNVDWSALTSGTPSPTTTALIRALDDAVEEANG
jgi:hypothetical protein